MQVQCTRVEDVTQGVFLSFFFDFSGIILCLFLFFFFFQAEDGIRDDLVTGVQTCALPILSIKYDSILIVFFTDGLENADSMQPPLLGLEPDFDLAELTQGDTLQGLLKILEIGRASCRERV